MADIEKLLSEMTLEEKVQMLSGKNVWETHEIDRLGIPSMKVTDGPNGARGDSIGEGVTSACFPVGSAIASTWNESLVEELGAALAAEVKAKGSQVLLGPTMNIHRTPLGGRNFECYSEDPVLSGKLATAVTKGLQDNKVSACLKHFICNDSEFERHSISSEVDDRTLREVYLRPFEMAVKGAQPWSIMSSYNRINGTYASSHTELTTGVLKDEWGFDGFVVSDWGAALETEANAIGGLDLEMPGPARTWGAKLIEAVKDGKVPETVIDDKVLRLLRVMDRTGLFDGTADTGDERADDTPEIRAVARKAAEESVVLIKNESGLLPLDSEKVKNIAVIGPNARRGQIQGGGSSGVRPHYQSHPLDAIRDRVGNDASVAYEQGCITFKYAPLVERARFTAPDGTKGCLQLERFANSDFTGDIIESRHHGSSAGRFYSVISNVQQGKNFSARMTGSFTPEKSGIHDFGMFGTGFSALYIDDQLVVDNGEGNWEQGVSFYTFGSTEQRGQIELEAGRAYDLRVEFVRRPRTPMAAFQFGVVEPLPEDMIGDAVKAAKDADAVVLVVGTNSDWETEGNDRLSMDLPGEQDALIEAVLAANPNTVIVLNSGAAVSMPWFDKAPAIMQSWFGGQEYGNALAALIFGDASPSGKMPSTFPKRLQDTPAYTSYPGENGKVRYGEGLYVGYRWYDARDIEPLVPFGHGLSYCSFDWSDAEAKVVQSGSDDAKVEVTLTITNKGDQQAAEVVQAYVRDVESKLDRPEKELKAFAKIDLAAGASGQVTLTLDRSAFEYWDDSQSTWIVEPGQFDILLGASSRDIRQTVSISLD